MWLRRKPAVAAFVSISSTAAPVRFSDTPNAPEITYRCETRFKRLAPTLENTIFRVAQEAVTNACIHGQSERVWVALIQHDEEVFLEVKDNGIGFDDKYHDRIFSVFQRLHGKGSFEGTGIGLAICKKIAERHNGKIYATSRLNEGSEFLVQLPEEQPNYPEGIHL